MFPKKRSIKGKNDICAWFTHEFLPLKHTNFKTNLRGKLKEK